MENLDAQKLKEMISEFEEWFNNIQSEVNQLIEEIEKKANQSKD